MRLLVTGGCGFVGSNFIRYVLQHYGPTWVTNVDESPASQNPTNLADVAERFGARYEFYQAECSDRERMDALFARHQVFAVIHTGAELPATLLETARHHGTRRFLQLSTAQVYGSLAADAKFTEEAPLQPTLPAASRQAEADRLVLAAHAAYGQEGIVLRSSTLYGPFQTLEELVPHIIMQALADQPVPLSGEGLNVRDWLHVEDLCAAIVAALFDGKAGEIYHVGGGEELRDLDIARLILAQLGKPETLLQFTPEQPGNDRRRVLDASKAHRELQWKPLHRPEAGLRETVEWMVHHRAWWQPQLAS